jgi:hypothetical protein
MECRNLSKTQNNLLAMCWWLTLAILVLALQVQSPEFKTQPPHLKKRKECEMGKYGSFAISL